MPWVQTLPNGLYRACWRDENGRQRSKAGFARKAAADRYAGEQEGKARRGEGGPGGRPLTWGEWSETWWGLRRVEPATLQQDKRRLDKYLTPKWGTVRLNRITTADVQTWVNELADLEVERSGGREAPLSAATVDRIYRLFSASMKAAQRHGRISANPCQGITLPTVAPGHERYLTRAEFDLVAFHLDPVPYRAAALLLVGTGLRFGEMAGLHWQRVDLETRTIDVIETWDAAAGRIKTYPKGKHRRSVPIPTWLQPTLEALAERTGNLGHCGLQHAPGGARCRSGLVVAASEGGAMDGHNFGQRQWAAAVERAGVGPTRLHDLRHTYASWLVQADPPVQLQEVQRLLGHSSIITTQRYAHLGSSQHDRVRAALEGLAD